MDWMAVLEVLKVPGTVLVTDFLMWFKWAMANDLKISTYELKILADRLILFGVAGILLVVVGMDWTTASGLAGLGVFADAWVKTLKKEEPKTEPVITTG